MMVGGYTNSNKLCCSLLEQQPHAFIISHCESLHESLHAAFSVVMPQVGSIEWQCKALKRVTEHTEFMSQHVCLCIQLSTLSTNILII